MNSSIRRKLMEAETQPSSIEQWYRRAIALDRNWRENRREKEKLKRKEEKKTLKSWQLQALINQESKVQVQPRRQEIQQQQVLAGPAPMEGVERMNIVVTRPQQTGIGFLPRNLYAMKVDRSNRGCYNCGGFEHMAKHCKNQGTEMNRRIDTVDNLKRGRESRNPCLGYNNRFYVLSEINIGASNLEGNKKRMMKEREIRKTQVQKSLQLQV